MAVGAFPLIKLGALAIRQISKPLANIIKTRAKSNPFFRTYICMPPAQIYHYLDVNVRMRLLGLERPANVKKLNETAAIELGAELLGETIIFFVAVLTLVGEYYRQSKNSAASAAILEERWTTIEKKVEDLEFLTEQQRTEIRELSRLVFSVTPGRKPNVNVTNEPVNNSNQKPKTPSQSDDKKTDTLQDSIQDSLKKM